VGRRHERGEPIHLGVASHEITGGATAASPLFLRRKVIVEHWDATLWGRHFTVLYRPV
jgi:hypothetical protein